jgi:hypothetical protein
MVLDLARRIELPIDKERGGKKEWNRKQAGEQVAQDFNVFTRARLTVEKNRQGQSGEKHEAIKNEHGVEVQWRINLAEIRKEQRASQEDGHLAKKAATENKFRGS